MPEYVIEFDCWEHSEPYEIHLEPEAEVFIVKPHDEYRFVAICDTAFTWAVRFGSQSRGLQIYPESKGDYEVNVYLNNKLVW